MMLQKYSGVIYVKNIKIEQENNTDYYIALQFLRCVPPKEILLLICNNSKLMLISCKYIS